MFNRKSCVEHRGVYGDCTHAFGVQVVLAPLGAVLTDRQGAGTSVQGRSVARCMGLVDGTYMASDAKELPQPG